MAAENPFVDLRRLADWFATACSPDGARPSLQIERVVERLGVTAVPLLGRELCGSHIARRDAARVALALLQAVAERPPDRGGVDLRD